jgi:hypothetical protein
MLKRVGSVLQAFVEIDGEWVQIDKAMPTWSANRGGCRPAYNNFEAPTRRM